MIEYIRQARRKAEADYRHAALMYVLQAPYAPKGSAASKPPKLPDILSLIELSE